MDKTASVARSIAQKVREWSDEHTVHSTLRPMCGDNSTTSEFTLAGKGEVKASWLDSGMLDVGEHAYVEGMRMSGYSRIVIGEGSLVLGVKAHNARVKLGRNALVINSELYGEMEIADDAVVINSKITSIDKAIHIGKNAAILCSSMSTRKGAKIGDRLTIVGSDLRAVHACTCGNDVIVHNPAFTYCNLALFSPVAHTEGASYEWKFKTNCAMRGIRETTLNDMPRCALALECISHIGDGCKLALGGSIRTEELVMLGGSEIANMPQSADSSYDTIGTGVLLGAERVFLDRGAVLLLRSMESASYRNVYVKSIDIGVGGVLMLTNYAKDVTYKIGDHGVSYGI